MGPPHVLRACDREGLTDVKTLLRRFPQTLYPTAVRQTDPRNPQVNRQALLSLQEGCLHRRQYQGAPTRIGLRVDVLVDAPTIAEGLQTFVDFIVDAIEGVAAASEGHAIRGVLLLPGKANWGSTRSRGKRAVVVLDKIRREQRGFDVAVKRATSSHHKVAMECTVRCAVPPRCSTARTARPASVMADRGGPRARDALFRSNVLHVSLPSQDEQGRRAHCVTLCDASVRVDVHGFVPRGAGGDGVQRNVRLRGGAHFADGVEE